MNNKIELLAPAGSPEALRTAVLYGADAVYMGGPGYGLRAKARNFTYDEMRDAVAFAHRRGVRVYVTLNILAHNEHLDGLKEYLLFLADAGADALIMADPGMIAIARATVPDLPVHLSTQAGATNYATFNFWASQGITRIVAAREISLREMKEIRLATPKELELEAFVHGAMCVSISGRCLLSNYMTGQESNLGACTHPCRWEYALAEKTREGEYFPIAEEEGRSFIFNSKDLCMVEYLPEMLDAGIASLKIEGRMKTPFYVAMVTKIYREALDDLAGDPALYESKKASYLERLSLVSNRGYETGFYLGKPGPDAMAYTSGAYIKNADFMGKALPLYREGRQAFEQRGKFSVGEEIVIMKPEGADEAYPVTEILNEAFEPVESVPHAQEVFYLPMEPLAEGTIIYKKKGTRNG